MIPIAITHDFLDMIAVILGKTITVLGFKRVQLHKLA